MLRVQVLLYSSQPFGPSNVRELNSNRVSQLVQISGIITSASKPKVCRQRSGMCRGTCNPPRSPTTAAQVPSSGTYVSVSHAQDAGHIGQLQLYYTVRALE